MKSLWLPRISVLPLSVLTSGVTGYVVGGFISPYPQRAALLSSIYQIGNTLLFHLSWTLLSKTRLKPYQIYTFTNPLINGLTITAARRFEVLSEKTAVILHIINMMNFVANLKLMCQNEMNKKKSYKQYIL